MRFYRHEKLAVVVDGPNLWSTAKALGFDIDYNKLEAFFSRQATLVSCNYFTRMEETEEFNRLRPLVDWLDFNGWQVFTRDKDTDVDLAVSVMEMSHWIDHFVLATGDGDFVSLVEALKRRGRRVTILSSLKVSHCSEDLRRVSDSFMELEDLKLTIDRPARAPKEAVAANA